MGLRSLRDKVGDKLAEGEWTEANVLYVLVEMRKYIERSGNNKAHLHEKDDVLLKSGDYPAVRFFRNWVAHTEKENNDIPNEISVILRKILTGGKQQDVEQELFSLLREEINKYTIGLYGKGFQAKLKGFFETLKLILAEQPVTLHPEQRRVGYDSSLTLREIK
jgi:hypothetical protein